MKPRKPNFQNRPRHILKNNSFYFLTVRTLDGKWFLKPDKCKEILLSLIKEKSAKFHFPLLAYVILNNHYHLIIKAGVAKDLPKFVKELNGASSMAINKLENVKGRKIWWNYYEHLIRNKEDFYKHLNYIHQNPVKHQLSSDLKYQFSSYGVYLKQKGKEYLDDAFRQYPIVDFMTFGDEF